MDNRQAVRAPGPMSVRVAACGGVVFFVLIVIQASLRSGVPSATDSGREIFRYVDQHQDRLQVGAVLLGLAMPAVLLWLSALFRALRAAEGGTPGLAIAALAGGVLAAASTVTGALIEGTLATRINDLGAAGVGVWWTMFLLSTGATLLGLLLLIGASAVICLRARLFGRWFAVAGIVLAVLSTVGACTIGYDSSGLQATAGIAVLLDSVWILLISFFLLRDPTLALP